MKYLAAYCLAALSGKAVTEKEVNAVLSSVGIQPDAAQVKAVVDALHGKQLHEVISAGMSQVSKLSFGGGSGSGSSAPAQGGAAPATKTEAPKAEEKKKEEPKEEEVDIDLGGGLFGDDF